jgi:hypothetical protein
MDVDDVGFALLTLISERALLLKEREALLFERGRAASQFIGAAEVIKDIESSIASNHYAGPARLDQAGVQARGRRASLRAA